MGRGTYLSCTLLSTTSLPYVGSLLPIWFTLSPAFTYTHLLPPCLQFLLSMRHDRKLLTPALCSLPLPTSYHPNHHRPYHEKKRKYSPSLPAPSLRPSLLLPPAPSPFCSVQLPACHLHTRPAFLPYSSCPPYLVSSSVCLHAVYIAYVLFARTLHGRRLLHNVDFIADGILWYDIYVMQHITHQLPHGFSTPLTAHLYLHLLPSRVLWFLVVHYNTTAPSSILLPVCLWTTRFPYYYPSLP